MSKQYSIARVSCTVPLHLPTEGGLTHCFHCRATMNGHFITIHIWEEKGEGEVPSTKGSPVPGVRWSGPHTVHSTA